MNPNLCSLRQLYENPPPRYLTVTPVGFRLRAGTISPSLSAELLTFHSARTLYQNRKPVCRSLDSIQALTEGRACTSCLLRKTCTPQVCLELHYESISLRLLLAHTSRRNFLAFLSQLRQHGKPVERRPVILTVRDRGRWGEVLFAEPPAACRPQSHLNDPLNHSPRHTH